MVFSPLACTHVHNPAVLVGTTSQPCLGVPALLLDPSPAGLLQLIDPPHITRLLCGGTDTPMDSPGQP